MPELNHKFQAGKMNKDLDERLVPNGEYRDALNVQVSTSDGSDVGSLQTILGNVNISHDKNGEVFIDPAGYLNTPDFHCIGSIVDTKEDKIYWLIAGVGVDIIAEYSYKTKKVLPVVVDLWDVTQPIGGYGVYVNKRALNFNKSFLVTGINIIDDFLFWTDNNTEPKKINITRSKIGSPDFYTQTEFYIKDLAIDAPTTYVSVGPLEEKHITVIKKSPQTAPSLEMKSTTRGDINFDGSPGEIYTTLNANIGDFIDSATNEYITGGIALKFNPTANNLAPDFQAGDYLQLSGSAGTITVKLHAYPAFQWPIQYVSGIMSSVVAFIVSWDDDIRDADFDEALTVTLRQPDALFDLKFPRFGYRYKYEDGEYSTFSPFSEVAFLPGRYDYLPKKGHNLGMMNNIRFLGVKNFVDERSIPEDVIAIDILYKESNSPIIYSVKTIDRVAEEMTTPLLGSYNEWNAISATEWASEGLFGTTKGFLKIESEMIHAMLPANQLLRGWDNVPRKALAQEVVGNRLVYGNYLQNYSLSNPNPSNPPALYNIAFQDITLLASDNIVVDLSLLIKPNFAGTLQPEELFPLEAYDYNPGKSLKTLRSYQLGIAYIDEFGRETPVFSSSKSGGNVYAHPKRLVAAQVKLTAQALNLVPEWARTFKYFVKETSNEYYNLSMDRWYNAEDGNIWISFPSSERNKVDIETFLILKKEHNSDAPVLDVARYKILALENEAPIFIKTKREKQSVFFDSDIAGQPSIGDSGGIGFPLVDGTFILLDEPTFAYKGLIMNDEGVSNYEFRYVTPTEGASKWYGIKSAGTDISTGMYKIVSNKTFGVDMGVTSPSSSYAMGWALRYRDGFIEFVKKVVREKPEYEGRFFAKIEKDLTITNAIIGNTNTDNSLVVTNAIRSQYINPEAVSVLNNTYSGNGSWFGFDEDFISISSDADAEINPYYHPSMDDGQGEAYWEMAGKTPGTTSASSGWFIDKIEAFRNVKFTNYYFGQDDSYWTNADLTTYGNPDPGFWYQGFLGSWTSTTLPSISMYPDAFTFEEYKEHAGQLQLINTSTQYFASGDSYLNQVDLRRPEQGGFNTEWQSVTNFPSPNPGSYTYSHSSYYPLLNDFPVTEHGLITPSFGIETPATGANMSVIHLSYTGVGGDESYKQITNLDQLNTDFNAAPWAGDYVQEQGFIDAISTPGTTWRWKEDPGKVVYKTQHPVGLVSSTTPYDGSLYTYTYTPESWAANTIDRIDEKPGVALWNYTKFEDYPWGHDFEINLIKESTGPGDGGTTWTNTSYANCSNSSFPYAPPANAITNKNKLRQFAWISQSKGDHCHQWYNIGANQTMLDDWLINFDQQVNIIMLVNEQNGILTGGTAMTAGPIVGVGMENDGVGNNFITTSAGGWSPVSIGAALYSKHNLYPMHLKFYNEAKSKRRRYTIHAVVEDTGDELGSVGPHFYLPTNDPELDPHFDSTGKVLTDPATAPYPVLPATRAPGIRPDGMYSGHANPTGVYILNDATLTSQFHTTIPILKMEDEATRVSPAPGTVTWEILGSYTEDFDDDFKGDNYSANPAVWETEPKEDVGLEIYHEVGQIYPTRLNEETFEQFLGPVSPVNYLLNSIVTCRYLSGAPVVLKTTGSDPTNLQIYVETTWGDNGITLVDGLGFVLDHTDPTHTVPPINSTLTFTRADGSQTSTTVIEQTTFIAPIGVNGNGYTLAQDLHNYPVTLPWFNCYSFGNGVESNRIRDDYNQVFIDKGPKVSTTLEEPYAEERRSSGLIYSGIYNSDGSINNLNQFIQAEKITKDLNPSHGTIQKLYTRNTDLLTFCEDKVFKILANKDALFNADGNPQLIATDRVLGQSIPFVGDFGISKNPESFAVDGYRNYFADKNRGAILRLSQDGMTPISKIGMTDWFSDNLVDSTRIIGSFDDRKEEYNINLDYHDFTEREVSIIGTASITLGTYTWSTYPNQLLIEGAEAASYFHQGDQITGIGIPPATLIASEPIDVGGGLWMVTLTQYPSMTDVVPLGDPVIFSHPTAPPPVAGGRLAAYGKWKTKVVLSKIEEASTPTLSFSEKNKGWVSFKSFAPENGVSLNNNYYTFKEGQLWEHHLNEISGFFYGDKYDATVEVLFNESPGSVKSFKTLNYEGSQSKITADIDNSGEYWDNNDKLGWYVSEMHTNLQEGDIHEFKDKEGKWFSQIKGVATEWIDDGTAGNIDTNEFSYQGIDEPIGIRTISGSGTCWACQDVASGCVEFTDPFICQPDSALDSYPTESLCLTQASCFAGCQLASSIIVNPTDGPYLDCTAGGSVSASVVPPTGWAWTVTYTHEDGACPQCTIIDPTIYTMAQTSNPLPIISNNYGDWVAVITTINPDSTVAEPLCAGNEINFTIGCATTACPSVNPNTISVSTQDTSLTLNTCNADGEVTVTMDALGAGATGWSIDYFLLVSGTPTLVFSDPTVYTDGDSAATVPGLEAGVYQMVITISDFSGLNCSYTNVFNIICPTVASCPTPVMSQSVIDATTNTADCTGIANGGMTIDVTGVLSGNQWQMEIRDSSGSLIGPVYGPFTGDQSFSVSNLTADDYELILVYVGGLALAQSCPNVNFGIVNIPCTPIPCPNDGLLDVTLDPLTGFTGNVTIGSASLWTFSSGVLTGVNAPDGTTLAWEDSAATGIVNSNSSGYNFPLSTATSNTGTFPNGILDYGDGDWTFAVEFYCASTATWGNDQTVVINVVQGCMDSTANNQDLSANVDDGSCTYDVLGCMDNDPLTNGGIATNYDPLANVDDGSCVYPAPACSTLTSIPDPAFENHLETHEGIGMLAWITPVTWPSGMGNGINGDGFVCTDRIDSITQLFGIGNDATPHPSTNNIESLVGIEDFAALEMLECRSNLLTTIDISENINLESCTVDDNQLTSIITSTPASTAIALSYLNCFDNELTTLDLSDNTNLTSLRCENNLLTTLDLSSNTALVYLDISDNSTFTVPIDLRNGNNNNMTTMNASGVNAIIVYVDNPSTWRANWTIAVSGWHSGTQFCASPGVGCLPAI